jgi:hypothetical protein
MVQFAASQYKLCFRRKQTSDRIALSIRRQGKPLGKMISAGNATIEQVLL